MKILCIGDVVGKPGRKILLNRLPALKKDLNVDFCIINGENAAGGSGITPDCFNDIINAGADCVTLGDHVWKQREVAAVFENDQRLLKPENYPADTPGKGFHVYNTGTGVPVAVCMLVGRVLMGPTECPFLAADRVLDEIRDKALVRVFEFHAEATSEKIAFGWHMDGRASAVVGTHTHVATADERVLPGGTAYITDLGMTGPHDGVIGRRKDRVIRKFLTSMPSSFDVSKGDVRINGALVDVDEKTGLARSIERVRVDGEDTPTQ